MLKIKQQFQDKVVKRTLHGFGTVSVNTSKMSPNDYQKWQKRGLDIFEQIEEPKAKKEVGKPKQEVIEPEKEVIKETIEEVQEQEKEEVKPKKTRKKKGSK